MASDAHRRSFRVPALAVAVAVYAALAATLRFETYLHVLAHYVGQLGQFAALSAVALPVVAILVRPRAPMSLLVGLLKHRGPGLALTAAGVAFGLAAFTTFKLAIPDLVPFHADPWLADADAFLHGGWNPGELARLTLPDWVQYPLATLYGIVWFLHWFGIMALAALGPDRALAQRYFSSMAATVLLLGTVTATALSSVGPVFYERIYGDGRFAGLMAEIARAPAGDQIAGVAEYLFANYERGGQVMGGGISAMPSMHLAVATLSALLLGRLSRAAGVLGWAYVAIILVGSVYLGWHYAIDGYVSILAVAAIWWVAGSVSNRAFAPAGRRAHERPAAGAATPVMVRDCARQAAVEHPAARVE